jgi:hypothetical protein
MAMVDTHIEGRQRFGFHEHDVGDMRVIGMFALELDLEEEHDIEEMRARIIDAIEHPTTPAAEAAQPFLPGVLADTDH